MKWPFVSRRRHEAELTAANAELAADCARLRGERDQFAKDRDAQLRTARTAAAWFTSANNRADRLEADLVEARTKLAVSMDAESALARQIHAMAQPVEPTDEEVDEINRLIRERDSEKRRADRLQKELDDATFLPAGKVENSVRWQPGYQDPKQDTA